MPSMTGQPGWRTMELNGGSDASYRHPQKHYIHRKAFCELFLLSGYNYNYNYINRCRERYILHVPLFPIVHSIKYNYINNLLEGYFCCQVTITITRIILRQIIYVIISWTMVPRSHPLCPLSCTLSIGAETEGLLDYQETARIMSTVRVENAETLPFLFRASRFVFSIFSVIFWRFPAISAATKIFCDYNFWGR